ncbi:MAG TPA: hypothetical protein VND65_01870 [Candidatus Binatia bacterium]|nr:hypothetical protein [Candidatus Binatia bacterium]
MRASIHERPHPGGLLTAAIVEEFGKRRALFGARFREIPKLLHEKWDMVVIAGITHGAEPFKIARSRVRSRFTAGDNPIDFVGEVREVHRPQCRFVTHPSHRRITLEQRGDSRVGRFLILDAHAEPYILNCGADRVRSQVIGHSLRTLREYLESVLARAEHHAVNAIDPFERNTLMKQVRHLADEDATGPAPAKRIVQNGLVQSDFVIPKRLAVLERSQAFVDRKMTETSRGESFGIAVAATFRDVRAACNYRPRRFGPFDIRFV